MFHTGRGTNNNVEGKSQTLKRRYPKYLWFPSSVPNILYSADGNPSSIPMVSLPNIKHSPKHRMLSLFTNDSVSPHITEHPMKY